MTDDTTAFLAGVKPDLLEQVLETETAILGLMTQPDAVKLNVVAIDEKDLERLVQQRVLLIQLHKKAQKLVRKSLKKGNSHSYGTWCKVCDIKTLVAKSKS